MQLEVNVHPEAQDELYEARSSYETIDPDLSEAFLLEIDRIVTVIREHPEIFQIRSDHRRANLKRFPYFLPYPVRNKRVFLLAVAHNSRKPGYWKDRLLDQ